MAFKIAVRFDQNDQLLEHYKISTAVCNGLVLEFARHSLIHKNDGKEAIDKIIAKSANPSANFLERIYGYNFYHQPKIQGIKIYRSDKEIYNILDNCDVKNDTQLIYLHLCGLNKSNRHAIVIKLDKSGKSYKIFDPNYGETISYKTWEDCVAALIELKQYYTEAWNCKGVNVTAYNMNDAMREMGMISSFKQEHYTWQEYLYRLLDFKKLFSKQENAQKQDKSDIRLSYY